MCDGVTTIDDNFDDLAIQYTYSLTENPAQDVGLDLIATIEDIVMEGALEVTCSMGGASAVSKHPKDTSSGESCGTDCEIVNGGYTLRVANISEETPERLKSIRCEFLASIQALLDSDELNKIPGVRSTSFIEDSSGTCSSVDLRTAQSSGTKFRFYIAGVGGGLLVTLIGGWYYRQRRQERRERDVITRMETFEPVHFVEFDVDNQSV